MSDGESSRAGGPQIINTTGREPADRTVWIDADDPRVISGAPFAMRDARHKGRRGMFRIAHTAALQVENDPGDDDPITRG